MQELVGTEVFAPWGADPNLYPGVVVANDGQTVHIAFLDGDEADVPAGACRPLSVEPGMRLQINWKGRKTYYGGVVSARVGAGLFMAYDDGAREWATIAQCRIPADVAATLGPAQPCPSCRSALGSR